MPETAATQSPHYRADFYSPASVQTPGAARLPRNRLVFVAGFSPRPRPPTRPPFGRPTIVNDTERSRSAGLKVAGRHAQLLGHDVVIVSTFNGRV